MPDPVEPVDTGLAKKRLRIVDNSRDDEIAALIPAARRAVENITGLVLTGAREVVETLDSFDNAGRLPRLRTWPILSVDAVEYDPSDLGDPVAIAGTRVLDIDRPARLVPALGSAFPTISGEQRARVTMTAGWAVDPDTQRALIPADLVTAILMMLRHLFDNPSAVVTGTIATKLPLGVEDLCAPYRSPF